MRITRDITVRAASLESPECKRSPRHEATCEERSMSGTWAQLDAAEDERSVSPQYLSAEVIVHPLTGVSSMGSVSDSMIWPTSSFYGWLIGQARCWIEVLFNGLFIKVRSG